MFDVELIRKDFPILQRTVHGKPLVYLDNAATSQKPLAVIDALVEYYERYNANVHRGVHTLSEEATARYEEAREKVRRLINAPGRESVIFTRNATESINLVAYAWGRAKVRVGDEIVLTVMEHHSNLVPWQVLAKETGARLRFVDIDDEGRLRDDWREMIGEKTRLVALTQMSNVLGTINPVREIADLAHQHGAAVLVDGAQSVAHMPVDVQDLDCDFLAFSSHKMLGPTGVGVLYARRSVLDDMTPMLSRRPHDQQGVAGRDYVERTAVALRGGNAQHRRRHRFWCRHRLPAKPWHGDRSPARRRVDDVRVRRAVADTELEAVRTARPL